MIHVRRPFKLKFNIANSDDLIANDIFDYDFSDTFIKVSYSFLVCNKICSYYCLKKIIEYFI